MCYAAGTVPACVSLQCDISCAVLAGRLNQAKQQFSPCSEERDLEQYGSTKNESNIKNLRKTMQLLFLFLPLIFQASGVYEIESDTLAQGQPALGTNTLASDGGSSDSAKSPIWYPGQLEPVPLFPALLGRNKLSCASYHLRLDILMSQSTVPAAPQHNLALMNS